MSERSNRIYLAAAYGRQKEMAGYAEELRALGYTITARWIDGRHETPPEGIAVESVEHLGWAAAEDVEDVAAADCVISFTGGGTRARGGRHVEFGIGLALGNRMILVGEREHVFHSLPRVEVFPTWEEARAQLEHEANLNRVDDAWRSLHHALVARTRFLG